MFRSNLLRALGPWRLALLFSGAVGLDWAEAESITEFFQERGYEPLKVERLHANHLLATGRIGRNKVRCLIDTGASVSLVDQRVTVGWRPMEKRSESLLDIFGEDVKGSDVFLMKGLEIGRCAFPEQAVVAVDLRPDPRKDEARIGSQIARRYERLEFEIVLGLDFLRRHHALIDCHAATIYIRPEAPPAALAASIEESSRRSGYTVVPLKQMGPPSLGIDGSIGGKPVSLLVDTGAWVTTIDRRAAKALGLKVRDLSAGIVGASGARADLDLVWLEGLKLGDYTVPALRVGTANMEATAGKPDPAAAPRFVGLLGAELLAFNGAIIDCEGAKLYLKPMEQPPGAKKDATPR